MIRQVDIKHIMLFQNEDHSDRYREALQKAIVLADQWWMARGIQMINPDINVVVGHSLDLYTSNPWYDVRNWLNSQGYDVSKEKFVVYLHGWNNNNYLGWGGNTLAVVGDWVYRALESLGTPEAIVDDWAAGYIIMHEFGHVLGLTHDFQTQCALMGYGWCGYNSILGETSERQLNPPMSPLRKAISKIFACRNHKYISRARQHG